MLNGVDHTIPVYICGTFFTLLTAWASDHYKNKPLFIMIGSAFGAVFFILCVAITNPIGRCEPHFRLYTNATVLTKP